MKQILSSKGFSLLETILALGLTAIVGGAGYAVMSSTLKQENNSRAISVADTEFAAGLLLSRNAARLAPFVNPAALGDCLRNEAGTDCKKHMVWKDYPRGGGTNQPAFHTEFGLRGACGGSVPCVVERKMRYRWICTNKSCTALESEVTVSSRDDEKARFADRSTSVTLDRRQFIGRAELEFACENIHQSMVGVDYNALRDQCRARAASNCSMPQAHYTEGAANDCRPDFVSSCAEGFGTVGLDQSTTGCVGANPGRTPGSVNTTTTTSTSFFTNTVTATATETSTVVIEPPPPEVTTWTWTGILYQTTCTGGGCDAMEAAVCTGPNCSSAVIQCYCVAPSGCHAVGATQPSRPGGFCF